MKRECSCIFCERTAEQHKGTPKEILESSHRIMAFERDGKSIAPVASITCPPESEMKPVRDEFLGGITNVFEYLLTRNSNVVILKVKCQIEATRSKNHNDKRKWENPSGGLKIFSLSRTALRDDGVYVLGYDPDPMGDQCTRTFNKDSEAETYYAKVKVALEWFAEFLCDSTLRPKLPPITIDGGVRGIFTYTITVDKNVVTLEILFQHAAFSKKIESEKDRSWLSPDGFGIISSMHLQLSAKTVYLLGAWKAGPMRADRGFENNNIAKDYAGALHTALEWFTDGPALEAVKRYDEEIVPSDVKLRTIARESRERQQKIEEQTHTLFGRQGFFTYHLIKTSRRLTFDIVFQHDLLTFKGEDDGPYYEYHARNGIAIISRSRMDIQTDRIWLRGGVTDDRSGSMVFSDNAKRDKMYDRFQEALAEWFDLEAGPAVRDNKDLMN